MRLGDDIRDGFGVSHVEVVARFTIGDRPKFLWERSNHLVQCDAEN
jgi:hypothetical protein